MTQGKGVKGLLVLLRFCLDWCQISYHARTMPLRPEDADLPHEVYREVSSKSPSLRNRVSAPGCPSRKDFGTRDPVLRYPAAKECLSSLCHAHTRDTLMAQATQECQISLELHKILGAGAQFVQPIPRPRHTVPSVYTAIGCHQKGI